MSKCNTIKKSKQGWTSMEPVDLFDALVQVPTSAFLYWSVPSSFDDEMMNFPISGQWLQVLSCFWELKLPGLHHGKVFRQWTWVRSPSSWLWWSPTVDNQHHVSATRCCQLQWVLVRKITSVRLLSSLTSMLTSSQVWWLWLWSQWFLSRHHWHNRKALNRSVIGLSGSMRRLLFVLSIISWYRLSRSLS